jgi:hypothetical protein
LRVDAGLENGNQRRLVFADGDVLFDVVLEEVADTFPFCF